MLKFEILTYDTCDGLVKKMSGEDNTEELCEVVSSFLPNVADGCEIGLARVGDVLLVRIFDENEYVFVYPIAISENANEHEALESLREYVVREEIPLVFYDVPKESVATLENFFRFTKVMECEDGLIAEVKSELGMFCDAPYVSDGDTVMSPITEEDIPRYSEISTNESLNRFWGYDYREDNPKPDDEYFYLVAQRGFEDGTALSLGVRYKGELIGEGCFWGFDLLGGAEIGFRILPEWQGRGFGRKTLRLLLKLGEEMGLLKICATVKKENIASVKLLDSLMERHSDDSDVLKYVYSY